MLRNFIKDETGQDVIEYSILLALLAAVAIFMVSAVGTNARGIFNKLTTLVQDSGGVRR
jgi:Flp pilus assembly pilin Flp